MRRRRRTDANQKEIVKALRKAGCSVEVLSDVGRGVPDLLVGIGGRTHLIEVKTAKDQPNDEQMAWYQKWNGAAPHVVRTAEDAVRVLHLR